MSLTRTTLHLIAVCNGGSTISSREFASGYPQDEVERQAQKLSRRPGVTSVSVCRVITTESTVALYRKGKRQ